MSKLALTLLIATGFSKSVFAFGGDPAETYYLSKLVSNSEKQVQAAKDLLDQGKTNSESLEKASEILKNLSRGLDKSIQSFQGTHVYEAALLQFQKQQIIQNQKNIEAAKADPATESLANGVNKFQDDSVKANLSDLEAQQKLAKALQTAEPGFVPKLQTQAQLGAWQASTRVSSQLTQLLSALDGLRKDMHGSGPKDLDLLLQGMASENRKIRGAQNVPR